MPANTTSRIASPCVKICQLDAGQICTGCGRSLGEIAEWMEADDARRSAILGSASRRLETLHKKDQPQSQ